jgi:hypothetical protein
MANDGDYKVMIAACKEFDSLAYLRNDGCRVRRGQRDADLHGSIPGLPRAGPFMKLLKEAGITTVGSRSRRIER